MSKLHRGAVAQLGCTVYSFGYGVFLFGYGLFIRVWSFHLGMVFSFGYGLFIWVCSFHSGYRERPCSEVVATPSLGVELVVQFSIQHTYI